MTAKKKQAESKTVKNQIQQIDFNKQFSSDYLEYGAHVIKSRAIPDVRDGLKPVQRRVLYTMFRSHLTSDKQTAKSAKVVGNVMGNFHPHGDCLAGDTQVLLLDGSTKTMEELYQSVNDGVWVLGTDDNNNIVPVYAYNFRIGQYSRKSYTIHFGSGRKVTVTGNHPFRLTSGDYVKAEDLQELDHVRFVDIDRTSDDVIFNAINNNYDVTRTIVSTEDGYMCTEKSTIESVKFPVEVISQIEENYDDFAQPYYDFTVDGYHNMFVISGDVQSRDKKVKRLRLVDVHNSAIYEALTNMAQYWSNAMPPVFPKGNFGNVKGEPPAAMRYTETKLSKFGDLFVKDLKDGIVKFVPNFDNTDKEPTVLPVPVPYLLISGTMGLAVGLKTYIPPHNPKEVLEATIAYLKNPNIKLDELMKIIPGPDFLTGGEIVNKTDLKEFYETGRGKVIVKGHLTQTGKNKLTLDTIPFTWCNQINSKLDKISNQIAKNALPGVAQVKDFTNKKGIDIEFTLKPGSDIEQVKTMLYDKTAIQDTMPLTFYAIVNGTPQVLSLKDYLENYVDFQNRLIINRAKYIKKQALSKMENVQGLLLAFPHIDAIVDLVRNAKSNKYLSKVLTTKGYAGNTNKSDIIEWKLKKHEQEAKKFDFSEKQAESILNTPLKRLSRLDKKALEKELKKLEKQIKEQDGLINSQTKRKNLLVKKHEEILKMFEDSKRLTKLTDNGPIKYNPKEVITKSILSVDKYGYIHNTVKPIDLANKIFEDEMKSNESWGVFTNKGNFYQIKMSDLPTMTAKDKGVTIAGFCKIPINEHPLINADGNVITLNHPDQQILMIATDDTGKVLGKLVQEKEFASSRKKLKATKLRSKGQLHCAFEIQDKKEYVVLVTAKGLVKKIKFSNFKEYGKTSIGNVIGKLKDDDKLEKIYLADNEDEVLINNKTFKVKDIPTSTLAQTFKEI